MLFLLLKLTLSSHFKFPDILLCELNLSFELNFQRSQSVNAWTLNEVKKINFWTELFFERIQSLSNGTFAHPCRIYFVLFTRSKIMRARIWCCPKPSYIYYAYVCPIMHAHRAMRAAITIWSESVSYPNHILKYGSSNNDLAWHMNLCSGIRRKLCLHDGGDDMGGAWLAKGADWKK